MSLWSFSLLFSGNFFSTKSNNAQKNEHGKNIQTVFKSSKTRKSINEASTNTTTRDYDEIIKSKLKYQAISPKIELKEEKIDLKNMWNQNMYIDTICYDIKLNTLIAELYPCVNQLWHYHPTALLRYLLLYQYPCTYNQLPNIYISLT